MPELSGTQRVSVTVTDLGRNVPRCGGVPGPTKLLEETHPDGTGSIVLGTADGPMCLCTGIP